MTKWKVFKQHAFIKPLQSPCFWWGLPKNPGEKKRFHSYLRSQKRYKTQNMSAVPKVIFLETHELWEDTNVPVKAASDIFPSLSRPQTERLEQIHGNRWDGCRMVNIQSRMDILHISTIITKQLVLCASAMILDQNKLKLGWDSSKFGANSSFE